jgi:tetratricopeptide (TPR) repeat protein
MRKKRLLTFVAVVFSLLLFFHEGDAQAGRGKARLGGIVIDEARNPIASAKVILQFMKEEESVQRETTTDKNGEWAFLGLGSGNWRIMVTAQGYQPLSRDVVVSQIEINPKVVLVMKKLESLEASSIKDADSLVFIDRATQLFNEKNYDEALTLLQQFLEKNPNAYQAHILVGDCYREKGDLDKAIESYNKAIEEAKKDEKMGKEITAKALAAIGNCYFKKEDFETAQSFFKQSIDTFPENEALAYNVGEIYFSSQKLDEAIQYFTIATQIRPDWPPPYYKLGLVNLNKADYEKAKEHLKKFLELEPDSELAAQVKNILAYLEKIKK